MRFIVNRIGDTGAIQAMAEEAPASNTLRWDTGATQQVVGEATASNVHFFGHGCQIRCAVFTHTFALADRTALW